MIAPPGAGKGTQGAALAERCQVPHIATGDLLRDHVARGTEIGRSVEAFVARGELVPDEVVLKMVRAALEALPSPGYVLDGFPRTLQQARALYAVAVELGLTADVALHLQVQDDELVRRLLARAAEQGRADDTAEVIAGRLALYYEVTVPILDWYASRGILVGVDGMLPPDEVTERICAALDQIADGVGPRDLTGLGAAFGAHP
jgi:adenylate kinase